ncbi:hypothetical protein NKH72_25885 [Mesorhizobium sp. M0955]|uniref:hypothetical protein n=1 Tax=unclassified Mesorhizobium TaxID=325217 RepID=UPI00333BDAAE
MFDEIEGAASVASKFDRYRCADGANSDDKDPLVFEECNGRNAPANVARPGAKKRATP